MKMQKFHEFSERQGWAFFCLVMMGVLYGAMTPVAKAAMQAGVPQFTLTGLRMFGAALFYWLFALTQPRIRVERHDLFLMALAAFLGIFCDQGLFILGLSYTSPIDAGVICTLIPVFALMLGVVFQGRRASAGKLFAIAIGLVGALLMVLSSTDATLGNGTVAGDLIIIAALISFSCYLVFFTRLIAKYPVHILMKWLFLFASLMVTPLMLHDSNPVLLSNLSYLAWLEVLFVVVGGTILAFAFMIEGQRYCDPEVVGIFNYIQPVVTCVLAVLMGLASFTPQKVLGTALVFLSVALVTRKSRNKRHPEGTRLG